MDATTQPQSRRFRITPGHFVLALLALEVLLWLSERFGWLGWHKGYAVLVCVAVVGVVMLAMVVWFGVAVVFRPRFQFGVRTLLVLTVAVAIPSSWVAVEMKNAREQKAAVEEFQNGGALVNYDYFGKPENGSPCMATIPDEG